VTYLDTERLRELVERSRKPPGYVLPDGVAPDVVERARSKGVPLPAAFVEWLELSNGPLIGPGGFYGLEADVRDVEALYTGHPLVVDAGWRRRGWVPVAADGCGNDYVLLPEGDDGAVGFFEMIRSSEEPEYVVSSDLNHFLIGILERELGAEWWPFDAERMLEFDPGLAGVDDPRLLPWAE
jgi:SMI1 / KNR4 family (SUKH-1)